MFKKKKKDAADSDPRETGVPTPTKKGRLSRLRSKLTPKYTRRSIEQHAEDNQETWDDSQGSDGPPSKISRQEQGQASPPPANMPSKNPQLQPQFLHIPPHIDANGNQHLLNPIMPFQPGAIAGQTQQGYPPLPAIPGQIQQAFPLPGATPGQAQQGYPPPPFFYQYPYIYPQQFYFTPPNPVSETSHTAALPPVYQTAPSLAPPQSVSTQSHDAKQNPEDGDSALFRNLRTRVLRRRKNAGGQCRGQSKNRRGHTKRARKEADNGNDDECKGLPLLRNAQRGHDDNEDKDKELPRPRRTRSHPRQVGWTGQDEETDSEHTSDDNETPDELKEQPRHHRGRAAQSDQPMLKSSANTKPKATLGKARGRKSALESDDDIPRSTTPEYKDLTEAQLQAPLPHVPRYPNSPIDLDLKWWQYVRMQKTHLRTGWSTRTSGGYGGNRLSWDWEQGKKSVDLCQGAIRCKNCEDVLVRPHSRKAEAQLDTACLVCKEKGFYIVKCKAREITYKYLGGVHWQHQGWHTHGEVPPIRPEEEAVQELADILNHHPDATPLQLLHRIATLEGFTIPAGEIDKAFQNHGRLGEWTKKILQGGFNSKKSDGDSLIHQLAEFHEQFSHIIVNSSLNPLVISFQTKFMRRCSYQKALKEVPEETRPPKKTRLLKKTPVAQARVESEAEEELVTSGDSGEEEITNDTVQQAVDEADKDNVKPDKYAGIPLGSESDAAHKFFADKNSQLMSTCTFDTLSSRWMPAVSSWMRGATAEHYRIHFTSFFRGIRDEIMERCPEDFNLETLHCLFLNVVDYSMPQRKGFIMAYVDFCQRYRGDLQDTRSEAQLTQAGEALLKGCKRHYAEGVKRVANNSVAVKAHQKDKFRRRAMRLTMAQSQVDFDYQRTKITDKWPLTMVFFAFWGTSPTVLMLCRAFSNMDPELWDVSPDTTNAQEGMHSYLYQSIGIQHTLPTAAKGLIVVSAKLEQDHKHISNGDQTDYGQRKKLTAAIEKRQRQLRAPKARLLLKETEDSIAQTVDFVDDPTIKKAKVVTKAETL
ncbi:hypothetical protein NP233_g11846 [Leucocoprinus birnbaumii]|uniref:Uncharacterized protein n=1 Tax=Leucocoprinus birnbaumii TaxID=56174 RepID=A0AAD5YNK5_9AGAR|nr:hypothetical protein NP233_g11846 [Leucocoprinus birnbaumii]